MALVACASSPAGSWRSLFAALGSWRAASWLPTAGCASARPLIAASAVSPSSSLFVAVSWCSPTQLRQSISSNASSSFAMLPRRRARTSSGGARRGLRSLARPRAYSSTGGLVTNTTSYLRNLDNGAEIYLVGTAHVSKASAQEVRDTIRLVRPDAVMVELCAGRAARLRAGSTSNGSFLRDALGSLFAPGAQFGQQLFKMSMQGFYRFLQSLGMDPGAEFKAAMVEAERCGARIVYGDRDMNVTLQRLAGSVNPQLAAALIDERDEIMVQCLARQTGRVVGVVGLAHLDGIERRWRELQHQDESAVARIT
eukprot:scaffold6.g2758.t1